MIGHESTTLKAPKLNIPSTDVIKTFLSLNVLVDIDNCFIKHLDCSTNS